MRCLSMHTKFDAFFANYFAHKEKISEIVGIVANTLNADPVSPRVHQKELSMSIACLNL